MARSRIRSSLFGAFSHSATLASGNSVPIMGVTLKDLWLSKWPFSFKGSWMSGLILVVAPFWPFGAGGASWMIAMMEQRSEDTHTQTQSCE